MFWLVLFPRMEEINELEIACIISPDWVSSCHAASVRVELCYLIDLRRRQVIRYDGSITTVWNQRPKVQRLTVQACLEPSRLLVREEQLSFVLRGKPCIKARSMTTHSTSLTALVDSNMRIAAKCQCRLHVRPSIALVCAADGRAWVILPITTNTTTHRGQDFLAHLTIPCICSPPRPCGCW
jgi:hypothetical protein